MSFVHKGRKLGGLMNWAANILLDKTGTTLSSDNVQDAIEEINSDLSALSNRVSANAPQSAISITSSYTTVADGYLTLVATASNTVAVYFADNVGFGATVKATSAGAESQTIFIKKGIKITLAEATGGSSAEFRPLA